MMPPGSASCWAFPWSLLRPSTSPPRAWTTSSKCAPGSSRVGPHQLELAPRDRAPRIRRHRDAGRARPRGPRVHRPRPPRPAVARAHAAHARGAGPFRGPTGDRWTSASLTSTARSAAPSASCAPPTPTPTGASSTASTAYPTEFVRALTDAGWLAVLIPDRVRRRRAGHHRSRASSSKRSTAAAATPAAAHAQMYIMGTVLRHGSAEQKQRYLPGGRPRRAAPAGLRRHRARRRLGDDPPQDHRRAPRRPLRRQRPEGVDLARPALRPAAAAGAHHAVRRADRQDARPERLPGRPAAGRRARPDRDPADRDDAQPPHHRAVHPGPRSARRKPDRRGGHGLPLHHRRLERRAHPDRLRVDRRRALVRRPRRAATPPSASSSAGPIGANQGVQFPIAQAHARLEAADLLRYKAAWLFDSGQRAAPKPTWPSCSPARPPGTPPTRASIPTAATASPSSSTSSASSARRACTAWRPINNNLVLAYVGQHVLGMPRSY